MSNDLTSEIRFKTSRNFQGSRHMTRRWCVKFHENRLKIHSPWLNVNLGIWPNDFDRTTKSQYNTIPLYINTTRSN